VTLRRPLIGSSLPPLGRQQCSSVARREGWGSASREESQQETLLCSPTATTQHRRGAAQSSNRAPPDAGANLIRCDGGISQHRAQRSSTRTRHTPTRAHAHLHACTLRAAPAATPVLCCTACDPNSQGHYGPHGMGQQVQQGGRAGRRQRRAVAAAAAVAVVKAATGRSQMRPGTRGVSRCVGLVSRARTGANLGWNP
jgi:hypothetical protein